MRWLSVCLALLIIHAAPLFSYRFVCNGILADGTTRGDSCGPCDEVNAARWSNPNVPVIVDYSVLPQGMKESEWRDVVKQSFAAWNQVSGTKFRFVPIEAKSRREFGANDSFHEIFWIKDSEEWRRLVGSGEFGTLGATLPRYSCGGSAGSKRRIEDSDLVLNGLSH
ncbi:MAG TPA: hypothetical protein VEK06_03325, partial [Myxococcota bacterium]|nr:hypothetical protein [Myxococcota bacterium]